MSNNITVRDSIRIAAPLERVWSYTQDWSRRTEWDRGVVAVESIQEQPERVVRGRGRGGMRFAFQYKLFERLRKTSGAFAEVKSAWVAGGGGSWEYEAAEGATDFAMVNTLKLKRWIAWIAAPLVRWMLRRETRLALVKVKGILEGA